MSLQVYMNDKKRKTFRQNCLNDEISAASLINQFVDYFNSLPHPSSSHVTKIFESDLRREIKKNQKKEIQNELRI